MTKDHQHLIDDLLDLTPDQSATPHWSGTEPDQPSFLPPGPCAARDGWSGSPYRWVRSPIDGTSHRLANSQSPATGTVSAVCRHSMQCSVERDTSPEPPDLHNICKVCAVRDGQLVPLPPVFARDRLHGHLHGRWIIRSGSADHPGTDPQTVAALFLAVSWSKTRTTSCSLDHRILPVYCLVIPRPVWRRHSSHRLPRASA